MINSIMLSYIDSPLDLVDVIQKQNIVHASKCWLLLLQLKVWEVINVWLILLGGIWNLHISPCWVILVILDLLALFVIKQVWYGFSIIQKRNEQYHYNNGYSCTKQDRGYNRGRTRTQLEKMRPGTLKVWASLAQRSASVVKSPS